MVVVVVSHPEPTTLPGLHCWAQCWVPPLTTGGLHVSRGVPDMTCHMLAKALGSEGAKIGIPKFRFTGSNRARHERGRERNMPRPPRTHPFITYPPLTLPPGTAFAPTELAIFLCFVRASPFLWPALQVLGLSRMMCNTRIYSPNSHFLCSHFLP